MPQLSLTPSFLFVIGLMAAATASAKEPWELKWIEVRSPHFVVASAVSEKQTVDLSRDLEGFRAAVQIVTNVGRFEERIPTKVYVLPYAVEELGFKDSLKGYFQGGMRANYAAVIPAQSRAIGDVLKHEYVHFLVHNRDTLEYPHWFDEGFAELLSTLKTSGDQIVYGQPTLNEIEWLEDPLWMSFDELLDTRDVFRLSDQETGRFYAQSWLLVHYLMLGRPGRDFAVEATSYLRNIETGHAPQEAFEEAFGIPVSKLRNTLLSYITNDIQTTRLSNQNLPDVPIEVSPLASDSIAAELAFLARNWGEREEAKRYWDAALALNPKNTLALVGIGDSLKFAKRFDEAQPYYEKALAIEPTNASIELDYAEFFFDRARAANDQDEAATYLTEARRHFARSYKLDPQNPETLAMNGASYLRPGESIAKALESLRAAHAMLPSQGQIKYFLAQAYVMNGEAEKAEPMLRSVIAWGEAGSAEEASKLLQQLSNAKASDGPGASVDPPSSQ